MDGTTSKTGFAEPGAEFVIGENPAMIRGERHVDGKQCGKFRPRMGGVGHKIQNEDFSAGA